MEALVKRLETDLDRGLTSKKAAEVFAIDGPNTLTKVKKIPEWYVDYKTESF